jgi:hypothetical protein
VKRLAALLLVAAGAWAALRARRTRRQLRLDVYYDDGAMLSLPATTPQATAALARATEALKAVQP